MSHRKKSLTPSWITSTPMTDDEKHEFCRRRGYPHAVFLPQNLYDVATVHGYDMRYYVVTKPIPTDGVEVITHEMPSSAQRRDMITAALDAGLPLGANHIPKWDGEVYAAFSIGNVPTYAPVRDDVVTDKPAVEPVTNSNVGGDRAAETVRGLRQLLGDDMRPVSEMLRRPKKKLTPSTKPRWPCPGERKNRDSVSCHNCMPGLGGRCTCCMERD